MKVEQLDNAVSRQVPRYEAHRFLKFGLAGPSFGITLTINSCVQSYKHASSAYIGPHSAPAAPCQRSVLNATEGYWFHLNFNAVNGIAFAHAGLLSGVKGVDIGMALL